MSYFVDDQFQLFPWRCLGLWCAKHRHCEGMDTFNSDCYVLGSICRVRLGRPSHKGTIETTSQACGQMLACASTCSLVPMVICFLFSVCNYCLINPPSTPTLLWIDIPPKLSLLSVSLESPIAKMALGMGSSERSLRNLTLSYRGSERQAPNFLQLSLRFSLIMEERSQTGEHHASMTMEERLRDVVNTFHQSPGLQAKHRLDEDRLRSVLNIVSGTSPVSWTIIEDCFNILCLIWLPKIQVILVSKLMPGFTRVSVPLLWLLCIAMISIKICKEICICQLYFWMYVLQTNQL